MTYTQPDLLPCDRLMIAIETNGWAQKERVAGVTCWKILRPGLLPGLRLAAERSLGHEGCADPAGAISATLAAYGGNEFLAYRSLLSDAAMEALIARFELSKGVSDGQKP